VPFDARMVLPDLADLLTGLVYYLAALLATMREARWYASRTLPVGAAIVCSFFVIGVPSFAGALAAIVVGGVVVGIAARGAFLAGGFYEPQPAISRAFLALSVGVGLYIAGTVAFGVVSTAVSVSSGSSDYRTTRVMVATDGSLVRETTEIRPFGGRLIEETDLGGRILATVSDSLDHDRLTTHGVVSTTAIPLNPHGAYAEFARNRGYRGTEDIFVTLASFPPSPSTTSWYYMRRPGLVAIYDNRTSRRIGWLGPAGLSRGDAMPSSRFTGTLRQYSEYGYFQPLIALPSAVYRIDRRDLSVRKVFTAAPGEEVLGAAGAGDSVGVLALGPGAEFDAIATTRGVRVQSWDGTPELVVPHDPRAAGYGSVTVTRALRAASKPTVIWYSPLYGTLPEKQRDTALDQITEYGAGDSAIAHFALAPVTTTSAPQPTQWSDRVGTGLVEPIVVPIWSASKRAIVGDHFRGLRRHPAPAVVGWIAALVSALASAIIAWMLARRRASTARGTRWWTFVAFFAGPLGVLLMLSLLEWPAREPCPVCGQERVVTHELCEHCGAPFGAPAPDGTEIFEPVPA
jgi:hypothetical protein